MMETKEQEQAAIRFSLRVGSLPISFVILVNAQDLMEAGRLHDGGYEAVSGFAEVVETPKQGEPDEAV